MMTRRSCMAVLPAAAIVRAAPASEAAIERAHQEMWARFVDMEYGTLYDYAPFQGKVHLPTPEECRDLKPNGMAWWTPVENGGFFGGLYLSALCNRWKEQKSASRAREAHTIAKGLVRLARVGSTPGFIARGISTDAKSHYPASSSDQTYPWFYGMYRYLTSGLVKDPERQELVGLVAEKADALHAGGWRMPSDRQGFGYFGEWLGAFSKERTTLTGAEPQFDAAARLLFIHLAMHRLTGKAVWWERYRVLRDEKPEGTQFSRLDICSQGVEYAPPTTPARYPKHPPIWTSASSQAALQALEELEPDERVKARYRSGMQANARQAAQWIGRYRLFDNNDGSAFRHDWRFLNDMWVPQSNVAEAVTLATKQVREWHRQSPRKVYECETVRDSLFSAWVVALAGDKSDLAPALEHFRWDRMHTSHFFMAECARYA